MSAKPSSYVGSNQQLPLGKHPEDTQLLASDGDESSDSVDSFAQNTTYYHDGSNTSDISGSVGQDSILYYDLEEGSGTDVYDNSDEKNNATIRNSYTWISGKEGDYALDLVNGSDIYLDSMISRTDDDNTTIAAWMRWDNDTTPSSVTPMGRDDIDSYTWYFKRSGSYELHYEETFGDSITVSGVDTTDWFSGNWFHFAATVQGHGGDNLTFTAYVNGSQVGSSTTGGGFYDTIMQFSSFGKGLSNDDYGWDGAWDDITLFDTLLDSSQINTLYQYGPSGEISSDGSQVTLNAGGSEQPFTITPTSSITTADYPFVAFDITSVSGSYSIDMYNSSSYLTLQSSTSSTGTMRYNMLAVGSSVEKWRITLSGDGSLTLNYTEGYGISNFTVTETGTTASDSLYVSSSVLYSSIASGNMTLNHDPSISVNDTFTVWALTTTSTAPAFSDYVSSWSSYASETRGSLSSGTVTDFKLLVDGSESLSAVTFVADSTAPDADIDVTPIDPNEDETVTLSSIIFDDVEVYGVWYNAISYPDGFTDQDYSASEGQENYWSYSFAAGALTPGDYCFKVIASDGANNNSITQSNRDYTTVRFTVRESELDIDVKTFFGAGDDFTYIQYTVDVNYACDITITEWTQADASDAADTNTANITAGINNIAWEKIDTDANTVYYNLTFEASVGTEIMNGSYGVAQTTFYVEFPRVTTTEDQVIVSGRITKPGTYKIYDTDNEMQDSGTLTSLDFRIKFKMWTVRTNTAVDFSIKFTNGSQTCYIYDTYFALDWNELEGKGGGGDTQDQINFRTSMEFATTVTLGLLGLTFAILLIKSILGR
jgi:hypothetical protein